MDAYFKRSYTVRETGPVYYTTDMDKTAKWFSDILGWYFEIDERNEAGQGTYGCVFDLPNAFEILHIAPFTGIHMFYGEPKGGCVAFMKVQGIEALHDYVFNHGWKEITPIDAQPWGKMCQVTTPDGYIMQFFE